MGGESVSKWKLDFGGLQFSFLENTGIPLDFWRKQQQQYHSSITSEDPCRDNLGVGEFPSSCLLENKVAMPKIVKRAVQIAWAAGGQYDALSVLGGRTTMSYEDW